MKQACSVNVRSTGRLALAAALAILFTASTMLAQTSASPLIIYGQLLNDSGQTLPEGASLTLRCATQVVQVIQPDTNGEFQFILGPGPRVNMVRSAENDGLASQNVIPMDSAGAFDEAPNSPATALFDCELEASAPGYRPLHKPILMHNAEIGRIDAGSLLLAPIATAQGGTISVASLQAPKDARKEFEKGEKEARNSHLDAAIQHLESAVAKYEKYAIAWNELGRIYASSHQLEKASQAFAKATIADPKFAQPYVSLASLQLQEGENQSASETAGEALELNPGIVLASFIQAVANFRLNRLDAAEKTAREAEKRPHQNIPQLHVLLAQIDVRREDLSSAAAEMRAYLKESPQGEFAAEVKNNLEAIEKETDAGSRSSKLSTAP